MAREDRRHELLFEPVQDPLRSEHNLPQRNLRRPSKRVQVQLRRLAQLQASRP